MNVFVIVIVMWMIAIAIILFYSLAIAWILILNNWDSFILSDSLLKGVPLFLFWLFALSNGVHILSPSPPLSLYLKNTFHHITSPNNATTAIKKHYNNIATYIIFFCTWMFSLTWHQESWHSYQTISYPKYQKVFWNNYYAHLIRMCKYK